MHVIAQALQKVKGTDVTKFDSKIDLVTAEYKGSFLIERSIDPTDPEIPDYAGDVVAFRPINRPLDRFYSYRISQVKQFAR